MGTRFTALEAELWDVPWTSDGARVQASVVGTSTGRGSGRPWLAIFLGFSDTALPPPTPACWEPGWRFGAVLPSPQETSGQTSVTPFLYNSHALGRVLKKPEPLTL